MEKVSQVEIVGEGLQLKKLIEEANYTYEELAERLGIEVYSLEKYLCKRQMDIGSFIQQMEELFQKPYNQIVTPIDEQVKQYILTIKKNIKQYKSASENEIMLELCDLAMKYCQPYEQLMAKGNLAIYKYYLGFHNDAIEMMQEVIDRVIEEDFKELIAYYSVQSAFFHLSKDKKQSRRILETAEQIIEDEDSKGQPSKGQPSKGDLSKLTLFNYYYFYGVTLNRWGKHSDAREKLEKAVEYAEDDSKVARAFSNIAVSFHKEGSFKNARDWYNKALDKAQPYDDIKGTVLNNFANLYLEKGKIGDASLFIEAAMKLISNKMDSAVQVGIYDTYLDIHNKNGEKILKDIVALLEQCVVFNSNQEYLVTCLEKSLTLLIENKNYGSIQELICQLVKYTRLEGEKRPLNDLSGVAMRSIHYLEDEGRCKMHKAFEV